MQRLEVPAGFETHPVRGFARAAGGKLIRTTGAAEELHSNSAVVNGFSRGDVVKTGRSTEGRGGGCNSSECEKAGFVYHVKRKRPS